MSTLVEDVTELEQAIRKVRQKAGAAHHRCMSEHADGSHMSGLALLEMCTRSLTQAADAARYARHNLGRKGEPL